jgi:subtilisin family serine protease
LDTAVNNSINDGVTYVVAAGNGNDDACNYSPARVPNALTVGSADSNDARSYFSSFGTCVDMFAPGSYILSSWYTGDTATMTMSGTSMASPHVAGVAALYLETNPGASPATVAQSIIGSATLNKITGAGTGSPNRLLYSFVTGPSPTPTPTPTPTPSPTPPPIQNPTPSPTPSPSPPPTPSFSISAKGYKVKGVEGADLTWSVASVSTAANVDIWRNNSLVLTAANSGSQKDNINSRGAGSYTYRVCQSGTQVCSNSVTIVF